MIIPIAHKLKNKIRAKYYAAHAHQRRIQKQRENFEEEIKSNSKNTAQHMNNSAFFNQTEKNSIEENYSNKKVLRKFKTFKKNIGNELGSANQVNNFLGNGSIQAVVSEKSVRLSHSSDQSKKLLPMNPQLSDNRELMLGQWNTECAQNSPVKKDATKPAKLGLRSKAMTTTLEEVNLENERTGRLARQKPSADYS